MSTKAEASNFPRCDNFPLGKKNQCCGTEETRNKLWNNKDDCFNHLNPKSKKQDFVNLILNILVNARVIYNIIRAKKMARKYYNEIKKYCVVIGTNRIQGGSGSLNLYLNKVPCDFSNTNRNTHLMRLLDGLPSLWACFADNVNDRYPRLQPGALNVWGNYSTKGATPYNRRLPFCTGTSKQLSANEERVAQYMKHADFFTDLLSSLKTAFVNYANHKFYCKVFRIPAFLNSDNKSHKVYLTGKELKMIYCTYLRLERIGGLPTGKLPYHA